MRKAVSVFMGVMLVAAMAMASPKSTSMTGYVSDAKCAAKGKAGTADHASCAKACVKGGEKAVFVNDKDGKVMAIANQDSVKDHVGDHVTIQASMADGALTINKVEAAK